MKYSELVALQIWAVKKFMATSDLCLETSKFRDGSPMENEEGELREKDFVFALDILKQTRIIRLVPCDKGVDTDFYELDHYGRLLKAWIQAGGLVLD